MTIRSIRKALASVATCMLACMLAFAPAALAEPTLTSIPNSQPLPTFADNLIDAGESVDVSGDIPRDAYVAGAVINVKNAKTGASVLAAGRDININGSAIGGSARLAGLNIAVSDVSIVDNVNAACADFTIDSNSSVGGGIMAACKRVTIEGSSKGVIVFASSVNINGIIDGDVTIEAAKVTFGPMAKVTGKIEVSSESEPVIEPGAQVGDISFTLIESGADDADAANALSGLLGGFFVFALVIGILGAAVCALLIELFFRRATAGAAAMVKDRTAPMLVTGVVGGIVAPIALLIALCLVVTMPLAGAGLFGMLAITIIATAFTGASLVKLVLPKMNRIASALIGGGVLGIVGAIPVIGWIIGLLAVIYLLGYILQLIFLCMKGNDDAEEPIVELDSPVIEASDSREPAAPQPVGSFEDASNR